MANNNCQKCLGHHIMLKHHAKPNVQPGATMRHVWWHVQACKQALLSCMEAVRGLAVYAIPVMGQGTVFIACLVPWNRVSACRACMCVS